jgi:uncharacterized membrane protein YkvA (DUF1232 family)
MAEKRNLLDPKNKGFFQDLVLQFKLIMRLMGDPNVNFLLKLLPIVSILYAVVPIDLFPEIAVPILGYLDDAAVLWLGLNLFVSLCPDDIVKKHREALENVLHGTWRDAPEKPTGDIIDTRSKPDDGQAK